MRREQLREAILRHSHRATFDDGWNAPLQCREDSTLTCLCCFTSTTSERRPPARRLASSRRIAKTERRPRSSSTASRSFAGLVFPPLLERLLLQHPLRGGFGPLKAGFIFGHGTIMMLPIVRVLIAGRRLSDLPDSAAPARPETAAPRVRCQPRARWPGQDGGEGGSDSVARRYSSGSRRPAFPTSSWCRLSVSGRRTASPLASTGIGSRSA